MTADGNAENAAPDAPAADPFLHWFEALERRHLENLSFQDIRRGIQALSSLYVERRSRIAEGAVFDGAAKRAAFACYFSPLHFLLVRAIVRALGAGKTATPAIVDLGCGTGAAAAAWALEMERKPRIVAVDRSSWALEEARRTYAGFGLRAALRATDCSGFQIPRDAAAIAAFTINELEENSRERVHRELLAAARRGAPVLVVEPIARRSTPWWPEWAQDWLAAGGREDEWRFPVELPERFALLGKAAGLDQRELTGRSLWLPRIGGD